MCRIFIIFCCNITYCNIFIQILKFSTFIPFLLRMVQVALIVISFLQTLWMTSFNGHRVISLPWIESSKILDQCILRKFCTNRRKSLLTGKKKHSCYTSRCKFEPRHEKICFCHMRTTKAQISLRIGAV